MASDTYQSGVLRERYDDVARTYTSWDAAGVQTSTRPYTTAENAAADAAVATTLVAVRQREYDRAIALAAPVELAALQQATLAAAGRASGATWVQPQGAHDAYPIDWVVTHAGKTWVSLMAANVWEPGVTGWREQVTTGYPAWVQPLGAQDAYNIGARVSFNGANYESLINANVWSPTVLPSGWQLI